MSVASLGPYHRALRRFEQHPNWDYATDLFTLAAEMYCFGDLRPCEFREALDTIIAFADKEGLTRCSE